MDSICERIRKERYCGRVTCEVFFGKNIIPRTARLKSLGFRDFPDKFWTKLNRTEAHNLLSECLSTDLAYSSKVMPKEQAFQLADAYLNQWDDSVSYFTNTDNFFDKHGYSYEPISNATFDIGVIILKEGLVGILWFEDED